jgi:glycosyltransferase involved in cell wall biosynthesis
MRILFISRAFPPVLGGIEKQNCEISKAIARQAELHPVVNPRGKVFLIPFIVIALFKAFTLRKKYKAILLGDGVLALLAFIIRRFSRVPVICIVHGLDITYSNFLYRKLWLGCFFNSIDHCIAVGNETIRAALARGLDASRFTFIPNGVDTSLEIRQHSKSELESLLGFQPQGPLILSLGRLVRRKGVLWFVENVMPEINLAAIYVIAGDGRDKDTIKDAIQRSKVSDRIFLLGAVSESDKQLLMATADLFVQPNIKVADDMEGFGLVVLEAALHARVVVASRLEGLADAITDGKNGILLESGNSRQYIQKLNELLEQPQELEVRGREARDFVLAHYSWEQIAEQYLHVIAGQLKTT